MNKCPTIMKKWRRVKVKNSEIVNTQWPFFWIFVGEDKYNFVKIQICYGEYLWLLAVKHKKKEVVGDSLLEGKCLDVSGLLGTFGPGTLVVMSGGMSGVVPGLLGTFEPLTLVALW